MSEEPTRQKDCSRCGRTLARSCFAENEHLRDGLNPWCNQCVQAASAPGAPERTPESLRQWQRDYLREYMAERRRRMQAEKPVGVRWRAHHGATIGLRCGSGQITIRADHKQLRPVLRFLRHVNARDIHYHCRYWQLRVSAMVDPDAVREEMSRLEGRGKAVRIGYRNR